MPWRYTANGRFSVSECAPHDLRAVYQSLQDSPVSLLSTYETSLRNEAALFSDASYNKFFISCNHSQLYMWPTKHAPKKKTDETFKLQRRMTGSPTSTSCMQLSEKEYTSATRHSFSGRVRHQTQFHLAALNSSL